MCVLLGCLMVACRQKSEIAAIVGRTVPVAVVDDGTGVLPLRSLLKNGMQAVDSIKAPVVGRAAKTLVVKAPESPLMNFAADALREMAMRKCKENIDIAISNKGGLRSELHEGVITFGDVYNVFPFENTLATLSLSGEQLLQLFSEVARENGEAVSGVALVISGDGKLLSAKVGGEPIVPEKKYRIATSDYLAQGNDGLTTLAHGNNLKIDTITIRDMMVEYISDMHRGGKPVDADVDGRIIVVK